MKKFFENSNKALLIINLFFLQSYLIRFSIGPYPSNLQEILIALNAIFFLIVTLQKGKIVEMFKNIPKHWIIFSLIILTGVSILMVPIGNQLDFLRHLKFLFFAAIFAFIFLETLDQNEKENAIKFGGIGAIIFGIFSITYNLLGYNVAHDQRLLGPLDSAVYLAYYLTPFFIYFAIKSLEKFEKENLFYAAILALMIIATKSMGAIAGSFGVIFLYMFFSSKILQKKSAKIATFSLGVVIAGLIFQTKILPTLNTEYSSLDERGQIWATSIEILKEPSNLLKGVGFGQFEHKYIENVEVTIGQKPLDYYVIQPHNIFLLFTMHYGILGLALILFIIIKLTQNIFKKPEKHKKIATYIALYFMIHGLIDTPIFKNDLLILFIIFLEIALTTTSANQQLNPTK